MRDHSNINQSSAQNNLHQYLNEPEIYKQQIQGADGQRKQGEGHLINNK